MTDLQPGDRVYIAAEAFRTMTNIRIRTICPDNSHVAYFDLNQVDFIPATELSTGDAVLRAVRTWYGNERPSTITILRRAVAAYLGPDIPTRATQSTQPAEQDPDAHTDGTTAHEPTQPLKPWAQLKHWHRDGKTVCLHLEPTTQDNPGFHFTLPNQSKITNPEQVAATIGSLASRKSDLLGLLAGKSDHDVVSVELLRRLLADAPADRLLEQTITEQMIDVEDLASLRRRAAMLPVVLLWRDATANALSALVAAVDGQGPGNALLAVAAAHAREVLTVDPEQAYGVAGPVEDVVEMDWLRRELAAMRDAHDGACQTIAAMHAAAVGEVRGPIRGVVEDVADLRAESTRWKTQLVNETARLRKHLAKALEAGGAALDQAEQDAKAYRAEIQRLGTELDAALETRDFTTEQLAEAQSRLRISEARRNMWTGRAGNALKRIATLTSDQPTAAEYSAAQVATMANTALSRWDPYLVAQVIKTALNAAWKVNRAPRTEDQAVAGGKTTLATIRIEFDPATRALLERAQTVVTGGIIPDVAGVLRDAQFEVLRAAQRQARPNTAPVVGSDWAWYRAITHASGCACGINDAGQRYIDLICQPSAEAEPQVITAEQA